MLRPQNRSYKATRHSNCRLLMFESGDNVSMPRIRAGEFIGRGPSRARIIETRSLSNGWVLVKTEGQKRPGDFMVRVVTRTVPTIRSFSPKIGHFAVDLFGKLRTSRNDGVEAFNAIIESWKGSSVEKTLEDTRAKLGNAWGYPIEYVLFALDWLLRSEDINFNGRNEEEQSSLDEVLRKAGVEPVQNRHGSELAIALFCDIFGGAHLVDALRKTGLDVIPAKRARGAV